MKTPIGVNPIITVSGSGDVAGGTNLSTTGVVPYVSASGTLNQDTAIVRVSSGILGATKVRTGTVYPSADSTTAFGLAQADGTTLYMRGDSTNKRVSIGGTAGAPAGTLHVYDATATTGATTAIVQAGAGQSTNPLLTFANAGGTQTFLRVSGGQVLDFAQLSGWSGTNVGAAGNERIRIDSDFAVNSVGSYKFGTATSVASGTDTNLSRIGAGIVGVGTGAAGSVAGEIRATSVTSVALTVATLPATPVAGQRAFVTDSNAASYAAGIGAVVAAGGSTAVPVVYDGTNWRIG